MLTLIVLALMFVTAVIVVVIDRALRRRESSRRRKVLRTLAGLSSPRPPAMSGEPHEVHEQAHIHLLRGRPESYEPHLHPPKERARASRPATPASEAGRGPRTEAPHERGTSESRPRTAARIESPPKGGTPDRTEAPEAPEAPGRSDRQSEGTQTEGKARTVVLPRPYDTAVPGTTTLREGPARPVVGDGARQWWRRVRVPVPKAPTLRALVIVATVLLVAGGIVAAVRSGDGGGSADTEQGARTEVTREAPPSTVPALSVEPTGDRAAVARVSAPYVLTVAADDLCWMSVRRQPDGPTVFADVVDAGATQEFAESGPVAVRLGNPTAVTFTVDGQPLELPGVVAGQPYDLVIEPTPA